MMIIELMIIHVMYRLCDNQQCWTERKNRDQKQRLKKTSDLPGIVYKVSWQKNCNYINNRGT